MHRWWGAWAEVVVRRPGAIVAFCVVLIAVFGARAALAPKDLSMMGTLSENEPEVIKYKDAVRTFGSSASLILLLEGEPDAIDRATERFVTELSALDAIRTVVPPGDPQWAVDRAPWLWPRALFDSALKQAAREAGRESDGGAGESAGGLTSMAVNKADETIVAQLRPAPRAVMIGMAFNSDIFDMAIGGRDYHTVEDEILRIIDELNASREAGTEPIVGSMTGMMALGAQDQNSVLGRIRILTPITLVVVLILLGGVEPRISRIALAGIALGGSVGIAFGAVSLILGKLTITATFFGMLLLGLGIDFAIHLLVALRDSHAEGDSPEDSVRHALTLAGPAITLGGLTTALASVAVAMVPQPGALDMGLTATFGLLASLFLMQSFLPAAWLLLERRSHAGAERAVRFQLPGLHGLIGFCIRYPKSVLFVSLLFCLGGVIGLPRYRLEKNLEKIFTRDLPAMEVERHIQELFGGSPNFYLVPVDTLEEARLLSKQLAKEPDIAAAFSAADWIRTDAEERRLAIEEVLGNKDSAPDPSADPSPDSPIQARLRRALELGPITVGTLPIMFSNGIVGAGGELAIRVVPKVSNYDSVMLTEQIARIKAISPTATGVPPIANLLMASQRDWVPVMACVILGMLLLVLTVSFRKPKDILLALTPVIMGAMVSLGIFFLLDLSFSILTGIVVPVILGLGVDDGIHVVERLRRYKVRTDDAIHEAVEGVGRAIFLTSLTTTISFVGLFWSNHYGLESMAQFMSLGVPLCFISSVTALPAAIKLISGSPDEAK